MTMLSLDRRTFVSTAFLTSVAGLTGCATPAYRARSGAIPFRSAVVAKMDGGDDFQLEWQADGVQRVTVYAGTGPAPVLTGKPAGEGAGSGRIIVKGLAPDQRPFFTLVPDSGAPLVIADRALHLPSIANLRDIGGYRTADGRWVKMGLLYRSDQLDRVSDADLSKMSQLGLQLVVDLRTQSERAREPDRLPPATPSLVLDVAGDGEGSLGGDMRKAMTAISSGKGVELLTEANRDFVSLPSARRAYAQMLDRLAAQQAPMLYHCTAGKDRTGWASAVILTLLGVPRETVMADYLASNRFLKAKNAAAMAALSKSGSSLDPAFLEPVLTVRASYLEAAFAEVEKRHGSFDAYIAQGLGISDATVERLRGHYLMGTAV
ncbi:hypothetical protein L288_08845 [Sphingobium quisquiliarum P25]|uniref:Tyrosine specific protein phosphatases domain-containing protein n=1 Tax=Sphingobium quisquiliarum P25 TaxID=1329909 RepID=T0H563_9SPHN|nr:tyrosine-protein phosphatase [Sphingobium quisquiliarum]EQB08122.1 hypothetical protein L288_08845 [Sphingobium quisquiliarum P25]